MKAHTIFLLDETGADTDVRIAEVTPAKPEDVAKVINAPTGGSDGRSEWVWIRLQNGDLALAVFPQGDTYEAVSESWQ